MLRCCLWRRRRYSRRGALCRCSSAGSAMSPPPTRSIPVRHASSHVLLHARPRRRHRPHHQHAEPYIVHVRLDRPPPAARLPPPQSQPAPERWPCCLLPPHLRSRISTARFAVGSLSCPRLRYAHRRSDPHRTGRTRPKPAVLARRTSCCAAAHRVARPGRDPHTVSAGTRVLCQTGPLGLDDIANKEPSRARPMPTRSSPSQARRTKAMTECRRVYTGHSAGIASAPAVPSSCLMPMSFTRSHAEARPHHRSTTAHATQCSPGIARRRRKGRRAARRGSATLAPPAHPTAQCQGRAAPAAAAAARLLVCITNAARCTVTHGALRCFLPAATSAPQPRRVVDRSGQRETASSRTATPQRRLSDASARATTGAQTWRR